MFYKKITFYNIKIKKYVSTFTSNFICTLYCICFVLIYIYIIDLLRLY